MDQWYSEVSKYDFDKGQFMQGMKTQHFNFFNNAENIEVLCHISVEHFHLILFLHLLYIADTM